RFPGGGGAGAPGGATNVNDLFRNAAGADQGLGDLFGNLFGNAGGASARRTGRNPRRGADIEGESTITFDQAIEGVTVGIQMFSDQACSACRGTGAQAGTMPTVCPTCQGSGMQASHAGGVFSVTEPCK
ncbi:molecular chaperone DnaJ, partial [Escherichia coli]|nr:molecular chaperone DnaJ [Escherichia coli]